MCHQNTEATIGDIRRNYWVPRLRSVLRNVIASCNVYRLNKATPSAPWMGPLPSDRLTPYVRPFSYTGLDYFGPVTLTVRRSTEKRWVALFTCLTVRAVHLELAHDLSTDSCIIALRNFVNRRGAPKRIRSDNGKNFVGADREAKRFAEVFDCGRLQSELSQKNVQWVFNSPFNPSEGGASERMVQCVKRVLRHTLKEREHILISFLIEAENVVNSRPLTHMPITADQEQPLTPNDFILGADKTPQTPKADTDLGNTCMLRKQWRVARQLRDHFWKRWITEYLPTLTRRVKWCHRTKPLKEGELVSICYPNVPRREWCRGRVEKVYPGTDGEVRRADVRTSTGIKQRAVSKLAILDIDG
uniref:Pro-Pol polyprotein n=1 Tax=Bactrocera latifrons TaxID=174628 RepID=A0A0K8WD06_BACLA